MRSAPDPGQVPGDDDPFDAAFGELTDRADLEEQFAALDAQAAEAATAHPFSDIEAALRETRAQLDADNDLEDGDDASLGMLLEDDVYDDADEPSALSEEEELSNEIEQLCQEALDALDVGEVETAREIALGAVRMDDEHPFPMFVLGLIAEHLGDLDTARDMAELALRTAETNPDAIGLRAHIHVRQHEFDMADQLLRFGIAHNPDEAMLHEGLARVSLARGRHAEALDSASAALRIEPNNPGALAVRTAALEEGSDRSTLLAALRQGVQLHPEDPYTMVELASVEMELGNLDRARMLLMRAQRLAPRDIEIGDVRRLIDHVQGRPLLRPVPALLRWMRDFPGGLAGFVLGFAIAALPLHAMAVSLPQYRFIALGVLAAWGVVAIYAWVAPAVLTHRLNQRAARTGHDRLLQELEDPLATLPDLDRVADVVSMLLVARDRRRAVAVLELAAERTTAQASLPLARASASADDVAEELTRFARQLRRPRMRARLALLAVPGAARVFVAVGVTITITAPSIAHWQGVATLEWHGVALACLFTAWLFVVLERFVERDVAAAINAVRLAEAGGFVVSSAPTSAVADDGAAGAGSAA
ncbi:MAG: tetratricopeptide repeat protein [Thermoleophilia bacterium]|nr:tetratricopeptide repeat protein [Thermoleophilia bacterium]